MAAISIAMRGGGNVAWAASQRAELEIVGQNLLDRHHPESGTSTSIRAPLVELERGVYGKVTYRF